MKWLLLVLVLLVAPAHAQILAFIPSSVGAVPACPGPTTIGASILPNTACTLTDGLGTVWAFCDGGTTCPALGPALFYKPSGGGWTLFAFSASQAQLNTGGGAFPTGRVFWLRNDCPLTVWLKDTSFQQFATPASAAPSNWTHNLTQSTSAGGFGLMQSGNQGDQFTNDALQAGFQIWWTNSPIIGANSGSRLTIAANSVNGCITYLGNAILTYEDQHSGIVALGTPADSFTVDGAGSISYANDSSSGSYRGINFGRITRWAVGSATNPGLVISHNDMGLLTNDPGPTATGNTHGTTTIDNLAIPVTGSGQPTTVAQEAGWSGQHVTTGAGTIPGMTIHDTLGDIPANTTIVSIASNGLSAVLSQAATGTHAGDTFYIDYFDTISHVTFDTNGNGASGAATHNMYIGDMIPGNLAKTKLDHVTSVCGSDDSSGGFELKIRHVLGQITASTFAEPTTLGHANNPTCQESAAVDVSCGGYYTFGGTGAGMGVVIEIGVGIQGWQGGTPHGFDLVRYGRDSQTGNCGTTYTPPAANGVWSDTDCNRASGGSSGCLLLIQNAYLINDSYLNANVVNVDSHVVAGRTTVKNSIIVQNTTAASTGNCNVTGSITDPCGLINNITMDTPPNCHFSGGGITDGGGNTCYATRTAAGLSAYPALPAPP